jgi:glycogen debranching enzyme
LKITVGPPRLAINQGYGVLVSDEDGQIASPSPLGLYHNDTRMISSWKVYANGKPWILLNSGNVAYYAARAFLVNPELVTEGAVIPTGSVSLALSRSIGGGVHEDLDVVNHGATAVSFILEIAIRSDFADLFEVKSGSIVRRGRISTSWSGKHARLTTEYQRSDFHRKIVANVREFDSKPVYGNGRLSFALELQPGGMWHTCVLYDLGDGIELSKAPSACIADSGDSESSQRLNQWRSGLPDLVTSNGEFYHFYRQSVEDMAALRLPTGESVDDGLTFVPAAGVPWFVALFGRDSLIVSLQNAMVDPHFARGTLEVLAKHQASERDDYRDAEPGKIMHELRRGELAHFKSIPHTPYYGTADATILYLIVLHSAWRASGDVRLLKRYMPVAEKCLTWIDRYGDRDGDGFQEYETRSSAGYENQGWKDAGEAVVYPDGSLVKGPKALCELQGYVYDAWLRMAHVFDALGDAERATELRDKAYVLFQRFNEVFWDEPSGYYAFALDGEKKPVLSVASNPGHCLWSGIVPPERAARVVKRLLEPDMWSGWGIRTLSSANPSFNPHSYQNGSVWPHDNAIIAEGFRRYGFAAEASRVARDISRSSGYFVSHQMPELYSGLQREPTNFPVQYIGANVPQGWAAGSSFSLLQSMLGFQHDAPAGKVYIDPILPDWLPDIIVTGLPAGDQRLDVRFWRDGEATKWEVIRGNADTMVQRSFAMANERWF